MADFFTDPGAENDPPLRPPSEPVAPPPTLAENLLHRYDANVQLILRRLADHNRTQTKPKWWWSR